MQGNHTTSNIIAVTEKVTTFIGKVGLWVRKLGGKSLEMFSCLKDLVKEQCGNK
jgi:hypothetical protein